MDRTTNHHKEERMMDFGGWIYRPLYRAQRRRTADLKAMNEALHQDLAAAQRTTGILRKQYVAALDELVIERAINGVPLSGTRPA